MRLATALVLLAVSSPVWPKLPPALERLAQQPGLKHASVGVYAAYVTGGETVVSHNEQLLLVPASGMKLWTAAAALDLLGPGHRYRTRFVAEWSEEKATLTVVGGGDPFLSREVLRKVAKTLRGQGLPEQTAVVLDLSRYEGARFAPGWQLDDLGYYYLPTVSALAVDKNSVEVFVRPGDPPTASSRPEYGEVRVEDGQGPLRVTREMHRDTYIVRGKIPPGHSSDKPVQALSVADPIGWANRAIEEALAAYPATPDPSGSIEAIHQGKPLSELIREMNQYSDNFLAEMLFLELGYVASGRGSFESGANAVRAFCKKASASPETVRAVDGSGLSRLNLATAESIVKLLRYAARQSWFEAFRVSLAQPGKPGTLARRLTDLSGRVRAKTGTMGGITSLSGYLMAKSGRMIAFCIIVNHGDVSAARRFQDETVRWLYHDREASAWYSKERKLRASGSRR